MKWAIHTRSRKRPALVGNTTPRDVSSPRVSGLAGFGLPSGNPHAPDGLIQGFSGGFRTGSRRGLFSIPETGWLTDRPTDHFWACERDRVV